MKCENCGQEFDGTVCPNCGTVADKTEGSISDSKIPSQNPLKYTEPASEKVKSGISRNKIFVAVITVLIALTALIVVLSIIFSNINTNLFHLDKIELVQIGMRKDEVKDIYGNPDAVAENDSLWTYYSENYKNLLKKAVDGKDISNEAAAFIHNEIRITFFDEKVYAVEMLINFSEKTKDTSREIKSVTYNQNGNASYSYLENEIYAIVEYRDGSYRNAPVTVTEQPFTGEAGFTSFTWHDLWSDSFRTDELNVVSDSEYEIKLKGQLAGTSVSYTAYKVNNGYALEINGYGDIKKPEFGYPWNQITSSLINVKISAGITGIGDNAFSWCRSLTSIRIPNSVTSIGDSVFSGCESLTSIEIPDGVTDVGYGAFDQTPWFDSQPDGAVYIGKTLYRYKGIMPADTNFSVREGTESIAANAFYGCENLQSISIPSGVTNIGSTAFQECKNLQSIAIPSGVTSIGSSAFYYCSSLLSIEVPNSVTSIGFSAFKETGIWNNAADNSVVYADKWAVGYKGTLSNVTLKADTVGIGDDAFSECSSLKSIAIPNGVRCIGRYAFYKCNSLLSIEIPDSVTSIGNSAFASCGNLTELKIAADVAGVYGANNVKKVIITGGTSIGSWAFQGCGSLESIAIPNSVTSIGFEAFYYCSSLLSIEISDSVTSIGGNAFDGCVNLKISVNEGNQFFSGQDGILYNKAKTEIKFVPYSVEGTLTIPNGITRIDDNLLKGRVGLTGVVIPDSVTSIDSEAFQDTGIWNNAAENSVVYADKWAVGYKGTLDGKLTFEADTVGIGDFAFGDCSGIRSVEVPDSVKNIGEKAFENCALTSMTMSASIAGAYGADKSSLQTLTITGTGSIPGRAFVDDAYDSLTNIVIENGVTGIGYNAFNCGNLTSIIIPQSVTSMGSYVFVGCPALTIYAEAAAKPEGWHRDWISSLNPVVWDYKNNETAADGYVYYIDNGIRYGLKDGEAKVAGQTTGLTTANIRETVLYKGTVYRVTSIGGDAFSVDLFRSRILKSVFIPDSVTSIGEGAFGYCSSLETIMVASGNPKYYSVSNCIIDRETKTLVLGCKNSIIPTDGSVTSIGNVAFEGCSGLQSIVIPNGVTSIGIYAFEGCSNLTIIELPHSVTSIGIYAFAKCSSLTSLEIPDSVTSIGDGTFWGCGSLQSIEIPDSVTSIGNSAFSGCSSLQNIIIPDGVTSIGDWAFSGCSSLQSIAIPDGVTSIGDWAFSGCSSLTSIAIPDSVTNIGSFAFRGCSGLTSIAIPDSVTNIGSFAFDGCSSLTSIAIPNGVTSIGEYAFYGCSSLKSIVIPDSVTSIGFYAFYECSSLKSIAIPDSVTSIGSSAFYGTGIWNNTADNSVVYADKWAVDYKGDATLVEALTLKADTVGIGSGAFRGCSSLTSIAIPDSITSIGYSAFEGCSSLTNIEYQGTKAEWKAITKGSYWNSITGEYTVTCTDGTLSKTESAA